MSEKRDNPVPLTFQHQLSVLDKFCIEVLPSLLLVELVGEHHNQNSAALRLGVHGAKVRGRLRTPTRSLGRRITEDEQDGDLTVLGKGLRELAQKLLPEIDAFVTTHLDPQNDINLAAVRSFWQCKTRGPLLESEFALRMPKGKIIPSHQEGTDDIEEMVRAGTADMAILTFPLKLGKHFDNQPPRPMVRYLWKKERMALVTAKKRAVSSGLKTIKEAHPNHLVGLHETFINMRVGAGMYGAIQAWLIKKGLTSERAPTFTNWLYANSIGDALISINGDLACGILPGEAAEEIAADNKLDVTIIPFKDPTFFRPLYVTFRQDNRRKKDALVALLECFFPGEGRKIFEERREGR